MVVQRTKVIKILMTQEEFDQVESEQKRVAKKVPLARYVREKILNLRK